VVGGVVLFAATCGQGRLETVGCALHTVWLKAKIDDVTPARDPALREPKAGIQSEKSGFTLEFIPYTMRGGNDKLCFRNWNY